MARTAANGSIFIGPTEQLVLSAIYVGRVAALPSPTHPVKTLGLLARVFLLVILLGRERARAMTVSVSALQFIILIVAIIGITVGQLVVVL